MSNLSVNMPASSILDIKVETQTSEGSPKGVENTFEKQLSKVKGKNTKDVKSGKSIMSKAIKDVSVKKSVDVKSVDEIESTDAVNNMILSLMSKVLDLPVEQINQILEEMNCTPTDLLSQDVFKQFLVHVYPENGDNQLLLNEGKLKDISKLFAKLEQISASMQGISNEVPILLSDTEAAQSSAALTDVNTSGEENNETIVHQFQKAAGLMQSAEAAENRGSSRIGSDEIFASHDGTDEGLVTVKQLDLGLTIPIHAFNSTLNARLRDAQNLQSELRSFMKDASITDQIINKIDIKSLGSHKEITMELSPKELGNLSIKIAENNGMLVANIRVDNEKTKELLLNEVARLEQTLEKQGLSVSEVKVDVRQNESHTEMEKQKQKSTKRIQDIINRQLSPVDEETEMNEASSQLIETEIDYMV